MRRRAPAAAGSEPGASSLRRILTGFLLMVVVPMLLLVALAAGIGYFRLQQGPVAVNFLVDPVKQGIDKGLPGLAADFDDVILTHADSGGLELRIRNLRLSSSDGVPVIAAPQAAIGLDAGSLWQLRAAPERVELIEPRIAVDYARDTGFSLSFTPRGTTGGNGQLPGESGHATGRYAVPNGSSGAGPGFDLARLLRQEATPTGSPSGGESAPRSRLREVGLRNAIVMLNAEGVKSNWQVPRLLVDLERRDGRQIISGSARISTSGKIWTTSFRADSETATGRTGLRVSLRDVVPRDLAVALPGLDALQHFDVPLSADIEADIDAGGEIRGAELALELSGSRIKLDSVEQPLLAFDAGLLKFAFRPLDGGRLELKPSRVVSGGLEYVVRGAAAGAADSDGVWAFKGDLVPNAGAGPDGDAAGGIGVTQVEGRLDLARPKLNVTQMRIALAGGVIGLNGEVDFDPVSGGAVWDGGFSGMPVARLAAVWPPAIAEAGRKWFSENVRDGRVAAGTISFKSGRYLPAQTGAGDGGAGGRLVIGVEAEEVVFDALPGLPPVTSASATARFEDDSLVVTLPKGNMDLGDGDMVAIEEGRFVGSEMISMAASGKASFKFDGPAGAVRKLFSTPPLSQVPSLPNLPEKVSGELTGEATIGFPLAYVFSASDIGYEVSARLKQGNLPGFFDGHDIKGASIDFEVSPRMFNAKGQMLVRGVLADVSLRRLTGVSDDAAPLILKATLDAADRERLGLELDEFVTGDVPVSITIDNPRTPQQRVFVEADLSKAELKLATLGWNKPSGAKATLTCEVEDAGKGRRLLKNLKVTGSDIAIEGDILIDADGGAQRFDFPVFGLDLVSRLNARGVKRKDGIWKINVEGKTFQGQAFFRSLFSVADGERAKSSPAHDDERAGFDVRAKIENVIGFDTVSLRDVALTLSSRRNRLTALQGRGTLDGGALMTFDLERSSEGPQLVVDSDDAGQAFKLVGFYPNMVGGRLRLIVDLDGSGSAQQVGTLWVERFKVLGDPIVSEVVGSADESIPPIARRQNKVTRQVFEFDSLRAPFAVGHGQIVLQDAALHGALLGATLRGKADFRSKTVDLGGTYVFLQGLNNVFAAIPLLGEILSGPRKEGIFGTNYAIRGSMERPQVFVHPLSVIAPGIFREIFQLAPDGQRVSPRGPDESLGVQRRPGDGRTVAPGRTIEGWNSEMRSN